MGWNGWNAQLTGEVMYLEQTLTGHREKCVAPGNLLLSGVNGGGVLESVKMLINGEVLRNKD